MLDETDLKIIDLLKENARLQWREIGELVHLTGQAVANRIHRMEKLGIVEGYTVKLNMAQVRNELTAYITVFMKTLEHVLFQKFLLEQNTVMEADRISGEGCYLLKVKVSNQQELNELLDQVLRYGNYRVNLSIGTIK